MKGYDTPHSTVGLAKSRPFVIPATVDKRWLPAFLPHVIFIQWALYEPQISVQQDKQMRQRLHAKKHI